MTLKIFRRGLSLTQARFNSLVFLEVSGSKITPASLSTVTAASQIGEPITAILAGPESASASTSASEICGISKVLLYKDEKFRHYLAEELSPLIKSELEKQQFKNFLVPASAVGKSLLPRLGALMNLQPISDIIKVESQNTFVRPIYAGNALATVMSQENTILASVRGSAFEPAAFGSDAALVEEHEFTLESNNRTEFVSEDLVTSERPELSSASTIVAGGRALQSKENFESLLDPLAAKLNAAIGASRVAVDSGFCDNSLQVGQTGKVVAPDLYIAVGISGAIQHLAGMKDSKTIVAINKDPDAPIFNIADVGLVADINEALPELTKKL